jgi:hypothetical protein
MGESTFGYWRPEAADTYWRRRFIALMIGFAVLGAAVWALSWALTVSQQAGRPGATRRSAGAAQRGVPDSSRQSVSQHHPGTGMAGSQRTSASQPGAHRTGATVKAVGMSGAAHPASTGQATGHGTILPAFCARSDIVLSLYTGQTQFLAGQQPDFDVNVVSTQQAECSFNIGSAHLALVVREGPAVIWSSADCAAGAGGLDTALKRGVPTVLAISWNRQTAAPGCSARHIEVPPGVYTAYAVDGDLTSPPVTFRLS